MPPTLTPCFWFDDDGATAAALYTSLFEGSRPPARSGVVTHWELLGRPMMAIDGGPVFRPNPALSMFVTLRDRATLEAAWAALSEGGTLRMPLAEYPWSPCFGWVDDRWGVSWQLGLGEADDIAPAAMFINDRAGSARQAMARYTQLFPGSEVQVEMPGPDGDVAFARLSLAGQPLLVMENRMAHDFDHGEGGSLSVSCADQAEVDHYWDGLIAGGGAESRCGWLVDAFGLHWQIVPAELPGLLADPERGPRVAEALMQMGRIDLEALRQA